MLSTTVWVNKTYNIICIVKLYFKPLYSFAQVMQNMLPLVLVEFIVVRALPLVFYCKTKILLFNTSKRLLVIKCKTNFTKFIKVLKRAKHSYLTKINIFMKP